MSKPLPTTIRMLLATTAGLITIVLLALSLDVYVIPAMGVGLVVMIVVDRLLRPRVPQQLGTQDIEAVHPEMTTVICPKCGVENRSDAMNCIACRVDLAFALEHRNEMKLAREVGGAYEHESIFSI